MLRHSERSEESYDRCFALLNMTLLQRFLFHVEVESLFQILEHRRAALYMTQPVFEPYGAQVHPDFAHLYIQFQRAFHSRSRRYRVEYLGASHVEFVFQRLRRYGQFYPVALECDFLERHDESRSQFARPLHNLVLRRREFLLAARVYPDFARRGIRHVAVRYAVEQRCQRTSGEQRRTAAGRCRT